jgi:hypothetical protein
MAARLRSLEGVGEITDEQFQKEFMRRYYKANSPVSESLVNIPFLGRLIRKYSQANSIESMFFLLQSGDPVVDQKMVNAMKIKEYEMRFGFVSGAIWGTIFAFLPGLKGSPISTRLFFFGVPFSLIYYRSFRRGYDQVLYVGLTYMEIIAKQKVLLKYLSETDGYLSDVKEALMKRPDYKDIVGMRGIKPFGAE